MPETKKMQILDAAMMDYNGDKYNLVVLGSVWAKHLRKNEEFRHQPYAAVIRAALGQILSGEVSSEQIMAVSATATQPREEAPAAPAPVPSALPAEPEEKPRKKSSKKEEMPVTE